MTSQAAMACGGVIWSSAAALAGPIHPLLGAAVLFLTSLLLARRLSINVGAELEDKVSGFLSRSIESGEGTPIALPRKNCSQAEMIRRKTMKNEHEENGVLRKSADSHCTCFQLRGGPQSRLGL